ncbi:MAG: hypothetical protein ABUL60_19400 [Myxococcales bacterium]
MMNMQLHHSAWLVALALLGCDGQQYVNPGTALLTVSHDVTGSKLVEGCNYVPVLQGSQIQKRYAVDDTLEAVVTLTRSDITVTFEGSGAGAPPFRATTKELESGAVVDDSPPSGYTVELASGCVPEDP